MGKCKFCDKWVTQPEGKKKKEFCNSTCRSNYWYGKNKKGKSEVVVAAPQEVYDAPKLPDNFIKDEPLSFDRLRQEAVIPATTNDYFAQMDKAQDLEELEAVGRKIKASGLTWKEQVKYHDYGKRIANQKFI